MIIVINIQSHYHLDMIPIELKDLRNQYHFHIRIKLHSIQDELPQVLSEKLKDATDLLIILRFTKENMKHLTASVIPNINNVLNDHLSPLGKSSYVTMSLTLPISTPQDKIEDMDVEEEEEEEEMEEEEEKEKEEEIIQFKKEKEDSSYGMEEQMEVEENDIYDDENIEKEEPIKKKIKLNKSKSKSKSKSPSKSKSKSKSNQVRFNLNHNQMNEDIDIALNNLQKALDREAKESYEKARMEVINYSKEMENRRINIINKYSKERDDLVSTHIQALDSFNLSVQSLSKKIKLAEKSFVNLLKEADIAHANATKSLNRATKLFSNELLDIHNNQINEEKEFLKETKFNLSKLKSKSSLLGNNNNNYNNYQLIAMNEEE